ncbi:MAG TPA: pilus assembly protein PilP [Solimonas sp.]|nr:pilus assembly protein PilP [Solimonas sp.]
MKPYFRMAALLASALFLQGCSDDMSDLERYVAEVKGRKSNSIDPIPQMKPYEAFTYVAGERRDPFIQVDIETKEAAAAAGAPGPRPDLNRNKEPLEEFPIDALRMVGTIVTPKGVFALIKAPDNVVHRVTLKDHMGQSFGEIVAITDSEVSLIELVPDGFGGWTQRQASIALAQ